MQIKNTTLPDSKSIHPSTHIYMTVDCLGLLKALKYKWLGETI